MELIMNLQNKWASDLTSKDRQKAQKAAEHIINTPDIQAWQCLISNADYLFSFIKDKIGQNLLKAINKNNYNNVFELFKYYSADWDDYLAESLSKFSCDNLNEKILNLLIQGSIEEKAYAAKYFCFVPYEKSKHALFKASQLDYQPIKINTAQALGKLNDIESFNYYINKLNTDDDWEKLEASRFLSAFGNQDAVIPMLKAMSSSDMSEHIAGEVATLCNIYELFDSNDFNTKLLALEAFDNVISGLSEIWTLSVLFDFKVFECIDKLINLAKINQEDNFSGKYAQLLLKAKSKISLFFENNQYTFDEEKHVLSELEEIHHLLTSQSQDFWEKQLENINKELIQENENRKLSAISVISDIKNHKSINSLLELISNPHETQIVTCEAVSALAILDSIEKINNQEVILLRITDENLAAIIRNSMFKR